MGKVSKMIKEPTTSYKTEIKIEHLEKELNELKKKLFIYETLQAEKEVEKKQVKGPFKSGKKI